MNRVSVDQVQAEAEAKAGIADPERDLFTRNLTAIVDSANEEGNLSARGVAMTHGELTGALANRLETLRWTQAHPEILQEPVAQPIFLTGLPRSGTTFFLYLFDRNPSLRLIRSWESGQPCPPPAAAPETIAPRIEAAYAALEAVKQMVPNFSAMHLADPEGPDECHAILTQTFAQAGFYNYLRVPSYFEFLLNKIDLVPTFRVHKRQLQLLQWRAPAKRWTLKYPNHVLSMPQILEVYPDAQFVMTHRDPVQTLASLCKLTLALRGPRITVNDPYEVGQQMRYFVRRHIDRLMEFEATPAARACVTHVDYYRLIDAPEAVLSEVYPKIGLAMTPAVRENIAEWHRSNPKGKRGTHSYGLEEFGLSADEIAEEYRFYTRHFDIPRESDRAR